jgi:hypothetical protein
MHLQSAASSGHGVTPRCDAQIPNSSVSACVMQGINTRTHTPSHVASLEHKRFEFDHACKQNLPQNMLMQLYKRPSCVRCKSWACCAQQSPHSAWGSRFHACSGACATCLHHRMHVAWEIECRVMHAHSKLSMHVNKQVVHDLNRDFSMPLPRPPSTAAITSSAKESKHDWPPIPSPRVSPECVSAYDHALHRDRGSLAAKKKKKKKKRVTMGLVMARRPCMHASCQSDLCFFTPRRLSGHTMAITQHGSIAMLQVLLLVLASFTLMYGSVDILRRPTPRPLTRAATVTLVRRAKLDEREGIQRPDDVDAGEWAEK